MPILCWLPLHCLMGSSHTGHLKGTRRSKLICSPCIICFNNYSLGSRVFFHPSNIIVVNQLNITLLGKLLCTSGDVFFWSAGIERWYPSCNKSVPLNWLLNGLAVTFVFLGVNNVKSGVRSKLHEKHDCVDGKEQYGDDFVWGLPLLRESNSWDHVKHRCGWHQCPKCEIECIASLISFPFPIEN